MLCIHGVFTMFAICAGNMRIDDAKIGGMTPETLILSGRWVCVPPYIFRPTMRFVYWTGIRRCALSKNVIAAIVPMTMARMISMLKAVSYTHLRAHETPE